MVDRSSVVVYNIFEIDETMRENMTTATNPTARRFPENGMTVAEIFQLAVSRMNMRSVPAGWGFGFNRNKRSLGMCKYNKKIIELSLLWLNRPKADLIKTIDHEIAHILCPGDGHGHVWKQKMIEFGHAPDRCSPVKDSQRPAYKFGIFYGDKLVKGYHNRPSAKVFKGLPFMYLTSQPESRGKLVIKRIS
jgi:hypothetical protein